MGNGAHLLEAIARSVERRRDHVAVEAADGTLTYGQLDRISNQLARQLRALGVREGARIAISLPRGAGELIAFLAVMKAEAAYVPLDPSHPIERLQAIVEDAAPNVLITTPRSALCSLVGKTCRTITFDHFSEVADGEEAIAPFFVLDRLAYVMFTSGSTGRPKGVEITHRALANFFASMSEAPGANQNDRLLAITTTSFDIAGLELFLPLYCGATVVIADRETARDARKLARRLEHDITIMQATPAMWRLLLEAGWRGRPTLKMLCGGEAMSPALADRLLSFGGELWNLYGPTETTIWSALERVTPEYDRITIGRPIAETQLYVLDEAMNEVEEGELYIGGTGLARGYCRRPELTAQRFVEDPQGRRLFKTGDLARRLEDGRIEYLGRLDHQVKIRGCRIELGEIEAILAGVGGVGDVLVVADQRENQEHRLVAYWVGEATREDLANAARKKLPAYMVPSIFVPLTHFPLSPAGKVDRKQLPPPEAAQHNSARFELAGNDTETRIAAMIGDVLGLSQVPLKESFFVLGGTSAHAMQVLARIHQETGAEMSLQAFYEDPSVAGIAARAGKLFPPEEPIVVELQRGSPEKAPLFCLFGVNLYQELAFALGADRPVHAAHVPISYVPGKDPAPALDRISDRYLEVVRRVRPTGPYLLLGLCFGGIVAYEVARKLEALGQEIPLVVVLDPILPSAVQIDYADRLRNFDLQGLRRRGERILTGMPAMRRLMSLFDSEKTERPQQLGLVGPELDAEFRRFDKRRHELKSRLLVVRAARDPKPSWVQVRRDLGWSQRAEEVLLRDVDATHLGLLREPYVRNLAQAIDAINPGADRVSALPPPDRRENLPHRVSPRRSRSAASRGR